MKVTIKTVSGDSALFDLSKNALESLEESIIRGNPQILRSADKKTALVSTHITTFTIE